MDPYTGIKPQTQDMEVASDTVLLLVWHLNCCHRFNILHFSVMCGYSSLNVYVTRDLIRISD